MSSSPLCPSTGPVIACTSYGIILLTLLISELYHFIYKRKEHHSGGALIGFEARPYLLILVTTPAPTVRPPSRIAKRRPCSIAIGASSLTLNVTVSPGMTI